MENKAVQGSDDWLSARMGRLTGSTFPTLMPSKRQKLGDFNDTQLNLIRAAAAESLTGEREEFFQSSAMQWGTEWEGVARTIIEIDRMVNIRECGFFEYSEHLGASPDGILGDDVAIWECKCPLSKTHVKYLDDPGTLLEKYKWQVYGEMMVTGIYSAVLNSFDPRMPESKRIVTVEIEATTGDMELMIERLSLAEKILIRLIGEKDE